MKFNSIIIRYGEIGLKGKNRRMFENKLRVDIKRFLEKKEAAFSEVTLTRGRLYVHGIDTLPELEKVFGIHSYSPALEMEKDMETLKKEVAALIPTVKEAESFRVSCQRVDKMFPHKSVDIERQMGERLYEATLTPVNLKHPGLNVQIEIGETGMYLFYEKIRGHAGMPYGSAGKLVSLVSSGIDSPVATFLMMKRGVEPILLHFKIQDEDSKKVLQLKEQLEEYSAGREIKLHMIPRDDIFKGKFTELYENRKYHSYICVMCKHLMHTTAGEIAEKEGALGIITGDNLAQVASQTLKNLFAYRGASQMPVYSPLIAYEKEQTVKIAREIGTYELSIQKAEGCTPPKDPRTGVSVKIFQRILKETGF